MLVDCGKECRWVLDRVALGVVVVVVVKGWGIGMQISGSLVRRLFWFVLFWPGEREKGKVKDGQVCQEEGRVESGDPEYIRQVNLHKNP